MSCQQSSVGVVGGPQMPSRALSAKVRVWVGSHLAVILGVLLVVGGPGCRGGQQSSESKRGPAEQRGPAIAAEPVKKLVLDAAANKRVAQFTLAALQAEFAALPAGQAPVDLGRDDRVLAHIGLWSAGTRILSGWGETAALPEALRSAAKVAKAESPKADLSQADTLIIELAFDRKLVPVRTASRTLGNIRTGLWATEIRWRDQVQRRPPSLDLAENRRISRHVREFLKRRGIKKADFDAAAEIYRYDVRQIHAGLIADAAGVGPVQAMYRGGRLIRDEEIDREGVDEMARSMVSWLETHLREDGAMTYNWEPSTSSEAPDSSGGKNNMIRQWMATNALIKAARHYREDRLWSEIAKKIDHDLEHYYVETPTGGAIEYLANGRKLGAMALAALAIVQHPERARWAAQERGLLATIDSLWHEDGYLDSFSPARGNRDNNTQNFYPGECLLLWATLYVQTRDEQLLARYMKSVEYYRKWHLQPVHRKPAFVPWHVQANYLVWTITRDERLRDFNFEMSDWLLAMQQWGDMPTPDLRGRFFDPVHANATRDKSGKIITPKFGGPHASATGVYMEGYIDAYAMARELGDDERADRYRAALVRGARSLRQLQFRDDLDMFYITDRTRARGGVRSTVYRQEIRVDNVQHGLMALLKMLEQFEPADFDVRHRK